ncbi:MAG: CehA/McbA family metallohydrolase [Acidobacteriia bacterium]|nr:CehA/McbA family metallohydrolase [Terriglobia bacterium]
MPLINHRSFLKLVLLGMLPVASAATVKIEIADEKGVPVAVRIRLRDRQGALHPPKATGSIMAHPRFPELGVVVKGATDIDVPPAAAGIELDRGTEYLPVTLAVEGPSVRRVRLKRWIDMNRQGWWSADLHAHRRPDEMPLLMDAADLNFAPAITKWNQNSNLETWPDAPMIQLSASRSYSVDNAEDERQWGAALFFGLKTPIPLYNARAEWPLPTTTWQDARKRGAFIDQEKIIWWAAPVMAALVPPDTIGVANNHFLEEGMLDNEAWGRPRDRARYPGHRGFANYIFDLYYSYLSAGFRIAASAGAANGVLRSPLGYSRSYVHLTNGFSPKKLLEAQKEGRNFVTNGPMLFVTVNRQLPGAVLAAATRKANVEFDAVSRTELETVEVILDGAVVRSFQPRGNASRIKARAVLDVSDGSWITVRCWERNAKTVRFAHTSPVYVGPKARQDAPARARLRDWIDEYMERVGKLPPEALTAAQKTEWLALCRQARDFYR